MATPLSTIVANVRINLQEAVAKLWTDAELLGHVNSGIADMRRALNTQYQNFFFDVNPNVKYAASADRLSSVPQDVSTILGLELADPTLYPGIEFEYKDYNAREFRAARAVPAQDATGAGRIFFCAAGAGGPVGAPTIFIAPKLTSALTLSLSYIPSADKKRAEDMNPVPGESDKALEAWATAHARSKIRPDQAPDPEWLAIYATEKTNILVAVAPRQEVTDQVAESVFGDY